MKKEMMKNLIKVLIIVVLSSTYSLTQVGSIKSETYQAEFEKKKSIDDVSDYDGPMIPIALINISASDVVYEMWPELKDARIGLGVTNMVIEYLDWTNRFEFVEEKSEIKDRMKTQWVENREKVYLKIKYTD